MKNTLLILALALSATGFFLSLHTAHTGQTQDQSAYEHIQRSGVLRCAYAVYPPFIEKDPNNGTLKGILPSVMAAFEKASGIKVSWGPEIDWGQIATILETGKADAFCGGMALTPKRGRVIAGSVPLFYGALGAFARDGDRRFDNASDQINKPDIRIAVNMGDFSEEMAMQLFPLAKRVYVGGMGGEAELFMSVADGKADITFSGPSLLSSYLNKNSGKNLRRINTERPISVFESVIGVSIKEQELLNLINATLRNLTDNATIEKIIRAHTGSDFGIFWFAPKKNF